MHVSVTASDKPEETGLRIAAFILEWAEDYGIPRHKIPEMMRGALIEKEPGDKWNVAVKVPIPVEHIEFKVVVP